MHIFLIINWTLDEEKPQGFAYPTKGYSSASGLEFGRDEWKQILNNLKNYHNLVNNICTEFLRANVASRIQMLLLFFAFFCFY